MTDPFRLDERVVLITGAGTGIGKVTALFMADRGAHVAVTEMPGRAHLAEAVAEEIRAQGHNAMALTLDVTASLTVDAAVAAVHETFGRLDVLVNNAGVQILKAALDMDEEEFEHVVRVNLTGAFLCAQASARLMVPQGSGCIINVASQHGVVGNHMRAPYSASKGGLISLTRALAVEWAPFNIRVNAVSPTFVQTPENTELLSTTAMQDEIRRGILLGRPALPADVAAGIVYLASPAAQLITGHNLLVDGGWTAH